MTSRWLSVVLLFTTVAGSAITLRAQQTPQQPPKQAPEQFPAGRVRPRDRVRPPRLLLRTNAFKDAARMPVQYTCYSQDNRIVSPPLQWSNTPMGTKSFTLMVTAPQNLRQSLFMWDFLWVLWNIPASATEIPEGVPQGAELPDGSRQVKLEAIAGYNPACAPAGAGELHYEFKLLALDTMLTLPSSATAQDVMKAVDGHIVGASVYYATMERMPE